MGLLEFRFGERRKHEIRLCKISPIHLQGHEIYWLRYDNCTLPVKARRFCCISTKINEYNLFFGLDNIFFNCKSMNRFGFSAAIGGGSLTLNQHLN
jgi:hypothetical protein